MTREKSDHFDGARFLNPGGAAAGQPMSEVPRMLREPRTPWPKQVDQPIVRPPLLDGAAATVTFIGHSTFLIQTGDGQHPDRPDVLQRAGPLNRFGPRRVRRPAVHFDDLPSIRHDAPQPQPLRSL